MPTTDEQASISATRFVLPMDLTTWVDRPLLLQWVVEEIDSLDWSNTELVQFLRANPKFQPRFLLVLIVFAYATGKYDSEEAADSFFADPTLKHLFPGQVPTPTALMRFRREYRGLLRWGLTQILKRAVRHHFDLGDSPIPAGLSRLISQAATVRLDAARHFDRSNTGE